MWLSFRMMVTKIVGVWKSPQARLMSVIHPSTLHIPGMFNTLDALLQQNHPNIYISKGELVTYRYPGRLIHFNLSPIWYPLYALYFDRITSKHFHGSYPPTHATNHIKYRDYFVLKPQSNSNANSCCWIAIYFGTNPISGVDLPWSH